VNGSALNGKVCTMLRLQKKNSGWVIMLICGKKNPN